jgi:histone acetyltransferase (RNA polymerase elongator complex component)
MKEKRIVDIAFFGGSFTGIPTDLQEKYLKEAFTFIKKGLVSGIRISTRPDYIQQEKLDLLRKYGVTTIELGSQSTNNEVLKKSGRGHNFESTKKASALILENGFQLGLQMMIGLPQDTFERSIQTANDIVALGAHNTRIYPTVIIKDTALERLFNKGNYKPLSIEEAVLWTKELVKIFEKNNVKILRIGLHPSEELVDGKSLIGGPFHPSFKELVMSKIWSELILAKLENNNPRQVTFRVNDKQLNYAVGFNGSNKQELIKKGINTRFIADRNLSKYQFDVSYN